MFYGEIDLNNGRFHYANAGHNYPILVKKDGDISLLKNGGPIVGALPDMKFTSDSVQLDKDDLLFLFTDGLSEAMDDNDIEYSEERIRSFVSAHRKEEPQVIVDKLLKDVRSFDPTYPPRDDTTIIALKVNESFNQHG